MKFTRNFLLWMALLLSALSSSTLLVASCKEDSVAFSSLSRQIKPGDASYHLLQGRMRKKKNVAAAVPSSSSLQGRSGGAGMLPSTKAAANFAFPLLKQDSFSTSTSTSSNILHHRALERDLLEYGGRESSTTAAH